MRSFVSFLYKLARILNDITTLLGGDPKRIGRRAKNKLVGRSIVKKIWRFPF
ncbi:MAG TPA: hypothetical protein VNN20_15115 [Thermodesulfobacteriota bacterium]|nr:hypothetical protein [Thermodesulfobacteriota bacterium]